VSVIVPVIGLQGTEVMACYAKNEEQVESFSCTACVCRFSSHTILASTGMSRTHAFLPLVCHRYVSSVVFLTNACEPRATHGKWAGAFGKRLPALGHGKPRRRNSTGQHLILKFREDGKQYAFSSGIQCLDSTAYRDRAAPPSLAIRSFPNKNTLSYHLQNNVSIRIKPYC
jgi:hypothetical protein